MDASGGVSDSSVDHIARWNSLYQDRERLFDEPVVLHAEVVHGFKRGSKELGIPTANLNMDQLGDKGSSLDTGIYFGWTLLHGVVYESVTSVGWNPFYKNSVKTIEVHLLHNLQDFYGETITVLLNGYLRQEANFNSLGKLHTFLSRGKTNEVNTSITFAAHYTVEELISCIQSDIAKTKAYLRDTGAKDYGDSSCWTDLDVKSTVISTQKSAL